MVMDVDKAEQCISKFSIYDMGGIFVCNLFNEDLGNIQWRMLPMVQPGNRYTVVEYGDHMGNDEHKITGVYILNLHRTATPAMVKLPNGSRVDNTLGGYGIQVLGILPKDEVLTMVIEDDSSGRNTPMIYVVQRFEELGYEVLCDATGFKLKYIAPTENVTANIVRIGG